MKSTIGIKIGSILLAFLLVLIVKLDKHTTTVITMPIVAVNLNSTKAFTKDFPKSAQVRISGAGRELLFEAIYHKWFNSDSRKLIIDLDRIKRWYNFPLAEYFREKPQQFVAIGGKNIHLLEVITPDTVKIRLAQKYEKWIPIHNNVILETASGYAVAGTPSTLPDMVLVSGAKEIVKPVTIIHTQKTHLTNIMTDISLQLPLILPDELLAINSTTAEYVAKVQMIAERKIIDIPIGKTNQNFEYNFHPSAISLIIEGGSQAISQLTSEDFSAILKIPQNLGEGKHLVDVEVFVPDVVTRYHTITPGKIELQISSTIHDE